MNNMSNFIYYEKLEDYETQVEKSKKYDKLQNNWDELKEYFKKQTIDLEIKREDMSADHYIDRKLFLKEILNKMQELEGKSE